jgi:predicted RNase H-like nuclease (RuvC/YqgF family)
MTSKDTYLEKMKAQLDKWDAEIRKLRAKAESAENDARMKYLEYVGDLESQKSQAVEKLRHMLNAKDSAWEELKVGFEKAYSNLQDAMRAARERITE